MLWFSLINVLLPMSLLVDAQSGCIYNQQMVPGQIYYIYNTEYPNYYRAGTNCRWYAESPIGTQIYLSCEEVNIPPSHNCFSDRVQVSLTGNVDLNDAKAYCGNGTLSLVSSSNRLSLALLASFFSRGGRLMCSVTSIPATSTSIQRPDRCDCGWRHEKRIVGGVETGVNEFPYMTALYHQTWRVVFCGATIISDRYVLSAGHCLSSPQTKNLILTVGSHYFSTNTSSGIPYYIENYTIHENYNQTTRQNDIAIIRTTRKIEFSHTIGPACLPFRYSGYDFVEQYLNLLGWGQVEFSGPASETLQKVKVQVMPLPECRQNVTTNIILNSELCTYTPNKDACQFDSGGPALWEDYDTRRLHLVGIISYGQGCAGNTASVNTRITSYLQWIIRMTGDAQYCIR